jgi:hypothetical protein
MARRSRVTEPRPPVVLEHRAIRPRRRDSCRERARSGKTAARAVMGRSPVNLLIPGHAGKAAASRLAREAG